MHATQPEARNASLSSAFVTVAMSATVGLSSPTYNRPTASELDVELCHSSRQLTMQDTTSIRVFSRCRAMIAKRSLAAKSHHSILCTNAEGSYRFRPCRDKQALAIH
jgi:hypothetical protein